AEGHRNHEGFLVRLPGRRRAALAERQAVALRLGVILFADDKAWRTGLAVPALELSKVHAIGIFHGLYEIIDRPGLTVMALEVQVAALAEALGAEQRLDHAHHFGTLLVHGQGVEVGYLDEGFGAHRVGHGTGVL